MTPRPDADDLHVAAPPVRADDAFVARLADVAAAATARDRRHGHRGSTLRVAFAAASVGAILTGGTWTAGQLVGADPQGRHEAPPLEQSDNPTASVSAGSPPTPGAEGSVDGDGRRDRDDGTPGRSDSAAARNPDGTDVVSDPGKGESGGPAAAGAGGGQTGSGLASPPEQAGEEASDDAGNPSDGDQGHEGDESGDIDGNEDGSEDGDGDEDGGGDDRTDCSPRQHAGLRSSTSDERVRQTVPRGGPVDDGGREGGCRG